MKKITKNVVLASLVAMPVLFATTANAAFVNNDSKNLAQCRTLVSEQIGTVDRMKVGNIKSRSRSFSVKFKVSDNGESSVFSCKLARDQVATVSCIKGASCQVSKSTASIGK